MRGSFGWIGVFAALSLWVGLAGLSAPSAGAVVGGYVEIHNVACPPGYTGESYFEDCHDNRLAGVAFSASGPSDLFYEDVTNAEGVVVFGDFLEAGTVTIAEMVMPAVAALRAGVRRHPS